MILPKTNKSAWAYARAHRAKKEQAKPKLESGMDTSNDAPQKQQNGNLYDALMGELDTEHNAYIKKLLVRNEKERLQDNSVKVIKSHERAKTSTNILIDSTNTEQKEPPTSASTKCWQREERATHQKIKPFETQPKLKQNLNQSFDHSASKEGKSLFISQIDHYLFVLSTIPTQNQENRSDGRSTIQMRQTVNFQNESHQYLNKLGKSNEKIKELKLKNYVLSSQLQKYLRKEKKWKKTIFQMFQELNYLTNEVQQSKLQRVRLEKLVSAYQNRFKKGKLERKTLNEWNKSKIAHHTAAKYLNTDLSQTDNDDSLLQVNQQFQALARGRKHFNAHKSNESLEIEQLRSLERVRRQKRSDNIHYLIKDCGLCELSGNQMDIL